MSISDLKESAEKDKLIIVFGAGSSIALASKEYPAKNWKELVKSSLNYAETRGLIDGNQYNRQSPLLDSNDIDELLSVAEFSGRKLQSPKGINYSNWMRSEFSSMKPSDGAMANALRAIESRKIPIATLNYDTLIETTTGLQAIDFSATEQALAWARRDTTGVLHLHGIWTNPTGCVFGIRDYEKTISNDLRDLLQRSLTTLNRILFVGCGDTFTDPNFSNLIGWLKANALGAMPRHYALVRKSEYVEKLKDPFWHGFVDPLSYGDKYEDLPGYLLHMFPTQRSSAEPDRKLLISAGKSSHVIDAYKNFILRDCGEMTLEGVRADLDTAQRKFNLEKLYVPIDLRAIPPVFPKNDPKREEKLEKWKETNNSPQPFWKIFGKHRRFTLLALPGGGKTMLLKRLAVAYSSSARRIEGSDNLPELDVVPLVIKCREWKEHITKPIASIIKSMQDIVDDPGLDGLFSAVEPRLKSGEALLLIDGLDEIHNNADRLIFVDNLERFVEKYPDIRLIVTSREAGFDLVAPTLGRFCEKYRIAPLNEKAVQDLCSHWQGLMSPIPSEARLEAAEVTNQILGSPPLAKLAENPLLLTMLLVVKHGDGKLPPDRVRLYQRAVEILLDTWNIRGHSALNIREAVPQLSCLAFEMLRQGKQTATESEIVEMISDARERIPRIGRYAKDSPEEFLRRVELRSSLLLEGGYQNESGRLVPFYQFRHLTFQEYLAAEAIVNGYTISIEAGGDVVDTLGEDFLNDKWKEVVPMVAVLLRHRAKPLLSMLLDSAKKDLAMKTEKEKEERQISADSSATPRLIQSMIEEAEFAHDIVEECCETILLQLQGMHIEENTIAALAQSVYGKDLKEAAWRLFNKDRDSGLKYTNSTSALFEGGVYSKSFWRSKESEAYFRNLLKTENFQDKIRATLAIGGGFWLFRGQAYISKSRGILENLSIGILSCDPLLSSVSAWVWGFWRHINRYEKKRKPAPDPSNEVYNALALGILCEGGRDWEDFSAAISTLKGTKRGTAEINLTNAQWNQMVDLINRKNSRDGCARSAMRIVFVSRNRFKDIEVLELLNTIENDSLSRSDLSDVYAYFGITPTRRNSSARIQSSDS